ncbi:hypothetical protein AAC387_Pa02g2149 [Persea americana]
MRRGRRLTNGRDSKSRCADRFSSPAESPLFNKHEREDQKEGALIYNGRRCRFDFRGQSYKASPRATLTPLRNDWAATEKMTRGINGALPVGY